MDRFLRRLWSELRCYLEETRNLKIPRIAVDGIVSRMRKFEVIILGDGPAGHVIASLGSLQFLWAMNHWSILADRDPSLTMPLTQERELLQERIYRTMIQLAYWFYSGTPTPPQWDYWCAGVEERQEIDFRTRIQVALMLLHETAHVALGHSEEVSRGWDEELAKEYPLLGAVGHAIALEYKADLHGLELLLSYVQERYGSTEKAESAYRAIYGFFVMLALIEEICAGRRPGRGDIVTFKLRSSHPTMDERRKSVATYLESRVSKSVLQCLSDAENVVRHWLATFDIVSGNLARAHMQLVIGSFAPMVLPPGVAGWGGFINPYQDDTCQFEDIYQP